MLEDHQAATAHLPAQQSANEPCPPGYPDGYAVVDVETTGLRGDDRIVSAAVYRLDGWGQTEDHWYTLVNPERDPGPTWIHGLTTDVLRGAPVFAEVAEEFGARLNGRVLVAHNAAFDWAMIAREFARAERTPPVEQRLCTIALAKALALPLRNHRLETLVAHFGVQQERAHHALDDARVLAEVFTPSLHRAARQRVPLPLLRCRPLTDWRGESPSAGGAPPPRAAGWRRSRRRPACPYPNPGRYAPGGALQQGMRVAFSGDTSVDREMLEDQAVEAGLHVATSVSGRTSLLVTNDPEAGTSKVTRARAHGTPVVDEVAFVQLLRDVAPAVEG